MSEIHPNIEINDKILEEVYQLLKRTRANASSPDCDRWSMLWVVLNANDAHVAEMNVALLKTFLECKEKEKEFGVLNE